jgi:inosine-uridine nucleoside N-ribohydrolase
VPIGVCRSGVTNKEGKFNGLGAQQDDGKLRYPHDLLSGNEAPDAVSVLREALADAANGSVVIAQVGFSTNLANLLDSQPDDISPLGGTELVKQKVRLLSMMAGAFTQIRRPNGTLYDHKEFNVLLDVPAAQKLATAWPTPIVWSGFEIGLSTRYPHESIERDYNYVKHHPLADAYRLYNPPPHDRPTWDLTSVLYAVRLDHGYFDLSEAGRVQVADNSLTTFQSSQDGLHRYLKLTDEQRIRVIEALVQLSSQPPAICDEPVD